MKALAAELFLKQYSGRKGEKKKKDIILNVRKARDG